MAANLQACVFELEVAHKAHSAFYDEMMRATTEHDSNLVISS